MNIIIVLMFFLNVGLTQAHEETSTLVTDPITWPLDFSVCVTDTVGLSVLIHPSNLIAPFNRPIVTGLCANNYWIDWEDEILAFNEFEYCLKILRTWTIISTCHGTQIHVQVIKVIIKGGPIIPCDAP